MNEIDKTNTPPPPTIETGQPPPPDGTTTSGTRLPYDTAGVPSPPKEKNDAPPLDHQPDSDPDLSAALDLSGTIAGSVEFDVFAIMDVMEKCMVENQKIAEDDALEAAMKVATRLKAAAHAMRDAAKFALSAGLVMGSCQIAGGAIAMGGAAKSTYALSDTGGAGVESESIEPTESESESTKTQDEETETENTLESTSGNRQSGETEATQEETAIDEDINTAEKKLQQAQEEAGQVPLTPADEQSTPLSPETDEGGIDGDTAEDEKPKTKPKDSGGNLMAYQKASNITTFAQGASQVTQGIGQVISTVLKYYSDERQADSKEIEAQSAEDRSLAEQKKAYVESIKSDADKIFDQMQQLMQSSYETTETITRV